MYTFNSKSLIVSFQAERERTNDLIRELEELKLERDNLKIKEKELETLKGTCQDQETALAELGIQVKDSLEEKVYHLVRISYAYDMMRSLPPSTS